MKSHLFALPLLTLVLGCASANAQPVYKPFAPAGFKVSAPDLEKVAAQLRPLCPATGWTVSVENNDVVVARDEPVKFKQYPYSPDFIGSGDKTGTYRLTMRFAPWLSRERYQKLSAENEATEDERYRLLEKHNLIVRGCVSLRVGYWGYVPPNRPAAQVKAYESDARKLAFHRLPNLYTPDYSLAVIQSWSRFEYLASGDENVDAECNGVRTAIGQHFGSYNRVADAAVQPKK